MKKLNQLLLVVNVIILGSLLFFWIAPFIANYLADVDDSMGIGMKPYFKSPPFTLLVDPDFPVTSSFLLGVEGLPVVFRFRSNDGSYEAKICVGLDHEIAIGFSNLNDPVISHISLVNNDMFFKDHGGDGTYEESFSLGVQRGFRASPQESRLDAGTGDGAEDEDYGE